MAVAQRPTTASEALRGALAEAIADAEPWAIPIPLPGDPPMPQRLAKGILASPAWQRVIETVVAEWLTEERLMRALDSQRYRQHSGSVSQPEPKPDDPHWTEYVNLDAAAIRRELLRPGRALAAKLRETQ